MIDGGCRVNKNELVDTVAELSGLKKGEAEKTVDAVFDTIAGALRKGDEVRIHGFGNFKTAQRAARLGRNPRTGEAVKVPARRVVRFSASTSLSSAVKGAKSSRRAKA